jgi:hypothetical protein
METLTKIIGVSLFFSLLNVTNCAAAARFLPLRWFTRNTGNFQNERQSRRISVADDPGILSILAEHQRIEPETHFEVMKRLYERGDISKLDFAKSVTGVFRNQATEERGLVDILCEQCGIPTNDATRIELITHCLCDQFLVNVPVLVLNIPESAVRMVYAVTDLYTNPYPDLCRAAMAEDDIAIFTEVFDQFGEEFEMDPEVIVNQSKIYRRAAMFRVDVPRGILKLIIGEREIIIHRGIFHGPGRNLTNIQDIFQAVLNRLQEPEIDGGAGLDEASAFHVFKQIVLAYRGQNGVTDGYNLMGTSLIEASRGSLFPKFNGVEISMKFENLDGRFVLVEKTEYSPILGLINILRDRLITSELRFKFPGDSEIRTQLPITSTRIPSADETIEWSCPFREAPPRKIIFYGGCNPVAVTQ